MSTIIVSVCFFLLGLIAFVEFLIRNYQSKRLCRESFKNAILGLALMAAAVLMVG